MQSVNTAGTGRILVLGGSGTIGRAAVAELVARGYEVVCILRPRNGLSGDSRPGQSAGLGPGVEIRYASVTDPVALGSQGFCKQGFDAVVSCLASRTGEPGDAWAIDYQANLNALNLAMEYGATQMVMLSAICVQKPRLAFQHAKLAFEKALMDSGLTYSIVRPTAFFKSLSGQIQRVQQGKPFVVFGDGLQTACKPISDADLAAYLADCLDDVSLKNKILPIGGPGPAITPRQQGEFLFNLLAARPHFKQVPVSIMSGVATCLGVMGKLVPSLKVKAELARIGYYYATESMLLLDPQTGCYDSAATPETGTDTLFEYYRRVIEGVEIVERGDHSIF
jgi:divinyl chlorophyllide a 8-vinyl-reductase